MAAGANQHYEPKKETFKFKLEYTKAAKDTWYRGTVNGPVGDSHVAKEYVSIPESQTFKKACP